MGQRGPVPERSDQRRRTNSPETETAPAAKTVEVPAPSDKWHASATAWYESLEESGQSVYYEPSDWAVAWLIAESISRDLKPQVVGINEESGEPVMATIPMKGASLAAYLKAMTALMVTEGDRRRARLELERGGDPKPTGAAPGVTKLDEYRQRLSG